MPRLVGAASVQWLLEHAPVDRRWCLIHATHTTDEEVTRFAKTGAVVGLCPSPRQASATAFSRLANSSAPAVPFGVGTDSNVLVGVADELRQLEYGQRLKHRERNVLSAGAGRSTGRALFDHALAGGSRALAQMSVGLTPGRAPTSSRSTSRIPRWRGARATPSSTAGSLPRAAARWIASGPAATRSSKAAGTDCARPRANTSTHRCGGSLR